MRNSLQLQISVLPDQYCICHFGPNDPVPIWGLPNADTFVSVTRTSDELSIVCLENRVPQDVKAERGWSCLKISGPLDFNQVGILSTISGALASADISLFVISTYETDYILIKADDLTLTDQVLKDQGYILKKELNA